MSRILTSMVLAALTAVCVYTAYITGKNQDMQSAWFFSAFSLLFVIPLVIIVIKGLAQKNVWFQRCYEKLCGPKQEGTRFVPHWLMMLFIFIFVILMAVNIIKIVFGLVKSY